MSQEASLQALVLTQQRELERMSRENERLSRERDDYRVYYELNLYGFNYILTTNEMYVRCASNSLNRTLFSIEHFTQRVCEPELETITDGLTVILYGGCRISICRQAILFKWDRFREFWTSVGDGERLFKNFVEEINTLLQYANMSDELRQTNLAHLAYFHNFISKDLQRRLK